MRSIIELFIGAWIIVLWVLVANSLDDSVILGVITIVSLVCSAILLAEALEDWDWLRRQREGG